MTEVAKGFAQMALQNQRLETELRSSLRELKASRSRIMSAADEERRRIERDLHDGAQQRLLALAIELELAGELVTSDPGKGAERLHELVAGRERGHGGYSLAGQRALPEPPARTRSRRGALGRRRPPVRCPTTLTAETSGPVRPRDRGCRLLLLSRGASERGQARARARRSVADQAVGGRREAVHFEVRDDGAGLPHGHASEGAGITNMRDRIGAMGGTLAIESHPGEGTCVMGAVPLAPADVPLPIDSLLRRATDALPDCFAIYRAVTDARGNVADFAVEHMNDAARRDLGVGARGPRSGRPSDSCSPTTCVRERSGGFDTSSSSRCPAGERTAAYEPIDGDRRRLMQSSELRAAPLGGGRVVVVWRDVTEHARADEELRLQSTVLRRAAEGVCLIRASDCGDRLREPALRRDHGLRATASSTVGPWPRSTGRTSPARRSWWPSRSPPISSAAERRASSCATGARTEA